MRHNFRKCLSLIDACILQVTTKPIVIYPNSGEKYDAERKEWVVSSFSLFLLLHLVLFFRYRVVIFYLIILKDSLLK